MPEHPPQVQESVYVWIVEHGDYEQRMVWLVAASVEAGVAAIKRIYGPPYIVRWEDVDMDVEEPSLVGHFEAVQGKSTRHTGVFDFTKYKVEQ